MFLADPALRHIAAATNDVLPEQLWRYDTVTDDPLGDLARILHKTARSYNDTVTQLSQAIKHLTGRAALSPGGFREFFPAVAAAMEHNIVLEEVLTDAYRAWRRHSLISNDERYLLLYPHDPTHGVATLFPSTPHVWQVTIDAEAAHAFKIPYADRAVGQINQTLDGDYIPIACTNPAHILHQPVMAYPLPVRDDLATACRSLLRWWALRHSAAWRSRTPDRLTPTELDQLAA